MSYSLTVSYLCLRARSSLSTRRVLEQTPLILSRFFRSCGQTYIYNRAPVIYRFQENKNTQLVSHCHNCVGSRTIRTYASETQKQTRHSLRNKAQTEKSNEKQVKNEETKQEETVVDESQLTLMQRFKKTYKEHAKILIGVHLLTSAFWFGGFFYAAHIGIDIIPVLEKLGCSEKIIKPFRSSSLGDIALAYLMYKLATPARYTVTLAGTNLAIRYLRKAGRVPAKQTGLVKEVVKYGTQQTQHRVRHIKGHWDKRRLKMRTDAQRFSDRLKSKLQSRRKSKTKVNGTTQPFSARLRSRSKTKTKTVTHTRETIRKSTALKK